MKKTYAAVVELPCENYNKYKFILNKFWKIMHSDVYREWCYSELGYYPPSAEKAVLGFHSEEDAMKFRLRWL